MFDKDNLISRKYPKEYGSLAKKPPTPSDHQDDINDSRILTVTP